MAKQPSGSGYCYEYEGKRNWRASSSERWPVETHGWKGDEKRVGTRRIDSTSCAVYLCGDGKFRAVSLVSIGEVQRADF
jgi:hypothetical protein